MRLSGVVVATALAAGIGMGGGARPPSIDMVSVRYGDGIPEGHFGGHWEAPAGGKAGLITLNAMTPGTGAGAVTFKAMLEVDGSMSTLCEASAPCASGPGLFEHVDCADNTIPEGARVHLVWSHTCDTAPSGNVIFGFEWFR